MRAVIAGGTSASTTSRRNAPVGALLYSMTPLPRGLVTPVVPLEGRDDPTSRPLSHGEANRRLLPAAVVSPPRCGVVRGGCGDYATPDGNRLGRLSRASFAVCRVERMPFSGVANAVGPIAVLMSELRFPLWPRGEEGGAGGGAGGGGARWAPCAMPPSRLTTVQELLQDAQTRLSSLATSVLARLDVNWSAAGGKEASHIRFTPFRAATLCSDGSGCAESPPRLRHPLLDAKRSDDDTTVASVDEDVRREVILRLHDLLPEAHRQVGVLSVLLGMMSWPCSEAALRSGLELLMPRGAPCRPLAVPFDSHDLLVQFLYLGMSADQCALRALSLADAVHVPLGKAAPHVPPNDALFHLMSGASLAQRSCGRCSQHESVTEPFLSLDIEPMLHQLTTSSRLGSSAAARSLRSRHASPPPSASPTIGWGPHNAATSAVDCYVSVTSLMLDVAGAPSPRADGPEWLPLPLENCLRCRRVGTVSCRRTVLRWPRSLLLVHVPRFEVEETSSSSSSGSVVDHPQQSEALYLRRRFHAAIDLTVELPSSSSSSPYAEDSTTGGGSFELCAVVVAEGTFFVGSRAIYLRSGLSTTVGDGDNAAASASPRRGQAAATWWFVDSMQGSRPVDELRMLQHAALNAELLVYRRHPGR